jgi:hypothetical protein
MRENGIVNESEKLDKVLDMILPELEQHYTQMISGPMSAVQSKRAKEASKSRKTEVAKEDKPDKPKKTKTSKTLKGSRNAAPKGKEIDIESVPVHERSKFIDRSVVKDLLKGL